MLRLLRISGLLCMLILAFGRKTSIAQSIDYSVHANIIYHFTKYIEWPAEKQSGDFVIGIMDNSQLFDELVKSTSGKSVGGQKITIKKIHSSQISFDCNILFIGEDASGQLKRVVAQTQNTSLLLVTEEEGLVQKGSCVNFIITNDKLKLEFNKSNIQKRNLKIAADLLSLGTVY